MPDANIGENDGDYTVEKAEEQGTGGYGGPFPTDPAEESTEGGGSKADGTEAGETADGPAYTYDADSDTVESEEDDASGAAAADGDA
jgi:hypothetical protein